jgi:hypothetical protein
MLIIYNIPASITVYFGEVAIPGNTFDYFNPLFLNSHILERINFVNRKTSNIAKTFKCNALTSKSICPFINVIMEDEIYYPPGFIIDYTNMNAYRTSRNKQKQICDYLSVSLPQFVPPNPIMEYEIPVEIFLSMLFTNEGAPA